MKTLFDKQAYQEIENRLGKLNTESKAQWGQMDAAQMMAHCLESFKTATGEVKRPRIFMGYIMGPLFKGMLINEKPYPKGVRTDPNYIITDKRDFAAEKEKLTSVVKRFHEGGEKNATTHKHPFFGNFSQKEWGRAMYKHLDHHLTQFGV
jgi:hypothetical protein